MYTMFVYFWHNRTNELKHRFHVIILVFYVKLHILLIFAHLCRLDMYVFVMQILSISYKNRLKQSSILNNLLS
jgi:hypothetical protein